MDAGSVLHGEFRELNDKFGALAFLTFYVNRAPVSFDDLV
jgi:hypothetical protein